MCPNYYVAADTTLTIIGYYRENGTLKGTLIHYPCHANLSDQNVLQPDYPGIALRLMDEQYPESISMFFRDVRPISGLTVCWEISLFPAIILKCSCLPDVF